MKIKDIFDNLIHKHSLSALFDALMFASGLVLCFAFTDNPVMLNIGCSIIASSVIGFASLLFFSKKEYSDEIINRWGMTNIYRSRSEMNADCSKDLDKALEHIDYIGFGFRSLMDSKSKIIEEKAVAGVKIRFLVMDPESPYLKKREAIEKSSEGSIKQSIYNLEKWIRHLREISKNPSNIQLRYYDSFPLDFYNRIDDAVYMGPYWFGKTSQQTVSYRFQAKSEGYNLYTEYFNDLWDSTDLKTRDALARRNK